MNYEQRQRQARHTAQHNVIARLAAAIRPVSQHSREHGYADMSIPAYDSLFRLQGAFAPILATPASTTLAHAVGQIEGVLLAARVAASHSPRRDMAVIQVLELAKNVVFAQTAGEIDQFTAEDLPDLEAKFAEMTADLPPRFQMRDAGKLMAQMLDDAGVYETPKA